MARVAIVTGGTSGIGRAISVALREKGYSVLANYASDDKKAQVFASETGVAAKKWDVSDFASCQAAAKEIVAEHGPVEIIVNNAGITRDGTMRRMERSHWDQVLDANP